MRLFILLILLAFPIAEIYLLIELADEYGWWLLVYLVVITYLGLQLIKGEKQMMSAKMMQSMQAGGNPFKTIMGSARNLVAGFFIGDSRCYYRYYRCDFIAYSYSTT
jgi:UPF0716 protein FxsA